MKIELTMTEAVKYVLDEYDKLISYVNNLNRRIKEQKKQIEELQRLVKAQKNKKDHEMD